MQYHKQQRPHTGFDIVHFTCTYSVDGADGDATISCINLFVHLTIYLYGWYGCLTVRHTGASRIQSYMDRSIYRSSCCMFYMPLIPHRIRCWCAQHTPTQTHRCVRRFICCHLMCTVCRCVCVCVLHLSKLTRCFNLQCMWVVKPNLHPVPIQCTCNIWPPSYRLMPH